ncbi:phage Mu protein [Gluconacetobacter sacchari DSM 12717]|uniref:Baseplate J/gp47 family protein n=2 Tax=Gluconacetobacter sacchari TaxID=92759 RepID=A0A7W4NQJ7_9PROT|nr:baseplate J/gp47 family protein [Gluconacetobacter sacchari]MBB2160078.1 baseplate J/gp47 family protein [Gluconacetobacter sacchari]GBQ19942.1 phage Mu protein [Gluconacetobacter sacchari DSM 12717]
MTLQIPTPAELAERFCTYLDGRQFTADDGTLVTLDGRAANTFENVLAVVHAMGLYELYLLVQQLAKELFIQTATLDGLLPMHADTWGVPRQGAKAAIGYVLLSSTQAVPVPAGTEFTVDGSVRWMTTQAVTIPAGSIGSPVPVQAETSGAVGNIAANTTLTLVSAVAGIASAAVDGSGLAGGLDIEEVEAWRSRILLRVRKRSAAGTVAQYTELAQDGGAGSVNVVPGWIGDNTVGVLVLMPGPTVPTAAQVASIQSYIDAQRPVRGNVTVVAGQIVTRNPTITLNPDTVNARALVAGAVSTYYAGIGLGGWIYTSQLSDAISSIAGEISHFVSDPTADEQLAANQAPVLGAIAWEDVA